MDTATPAIYTYCHPLSLHYALPISAFTIGSSTESSAVYQSELNDHFLPSQVWMRPERAPSWSEQVILIGRSMSPKPSSVRCSAVTSRFSRPQRTCSPVSGLLPNLAMAVRIASEPSMALTRPRLYSTSPTSSHLALPLPASSRRSEEHKSELQ